MISAASHSPVEFVEIILCHKPEVDPRKKKEEGSAEDHEPYALPLQRRATFTSGGLVYL